MLPNFLILGAPRAGTTWIDENLRKHPEIKMASVKEVHFFDRHYDKGIEFYESFFEGLDGETAVGEATPAYMHGQYTKHDIPQLIHRHLPDVRFVLSLRNPVERAYSRFWNSKAKFDHNSKLSFEEKLDDRPEFVREGFYYDHIMRYMEYFPRDRFLFLLYENIVKDPAMFLRRIYEFLEVDPGFTSGFESVKVNSAAGKRNLARSKLLWVVSKGFSRLKLHGAAESIRQMNAKPLPSMDIATYMHLVDIYRDKNNQLGALLGEDLSHWNMRPDPAR